MVLNPELVKSIDRLKPVDIVVGIQTKNVETTIAHVLNVVSEGLTEYFQDYKSLVVVSDGLSNDRTIEIANLFGLQNHIKKLVVEGAGARGKGDAIRTVFEIAIRANAKAVVLLDGDLLSIKPRWLHSLTEPVLYGIADLVVPYYVRDKHDGLVTNNLAYPLTRALYGVNVRQPIGGDFGLSRALVDSLVDHKCYPEDFGIDIFITCVAAATDMVIREALLGLKLHESATKYKDVSDHLIDMCRQVATTMFDLAVYYEDKWKEIKPKKVKRRKIKYYGPKPLPVNVNLERIKALFNELFVKNRDVLKRNLPKNIFQHVKRYGVRNFGVEKWVKSVYSLLAAFNHEENRSAIIDSLTTLWLARCFNYVNDTKDMSIEEVEEYIDKQAKTFEEEKKYLIRIMNHHSRSVC